MNTDEPALPDYPYWDDTWIARDALGRIGAFVTAGHGPIPVSTLEAVSIPISEIGKRVLEMPVRGEAVMQVEYPRPDHFLALGQRGLFVFDWSDVLRVRAAELGAYERVCLPGSPLFESDLSPELRQYLAYRPRFQVKFESVATFDPRQQTTCIEAKWNEVK